MKARRLLIRGTVVVVALNSFAAITVSGTSAAQGLAPVNPVRVDLGGHPANSGFLVFAEGNVALNADESEGTVAAGGNLSFNSTYNVAAHTPVDATFTVPGDAGPTYLYVGGGMDFTGSQVLRVLNNGFAKIANSATYTARNTDQNGAAVNYEVLEPGAAYNSTPRIEGTTGLQTPASIATPVPSSLIDINGAFTLYRQLTTEMAACPDNTVLTDPNGGAAPIPQPYPSSSSARLTLTPGVTNVLEMTTADLANLSQITFTNQPSASTPLVVNVTGTSYFGATPNLAGISGSQAPYILWNFPQAQAIVVTGGASIEGTIYAPNAALNWRPTQNIEGNVIAAAFTHGPSVGDLGEVRELHDFPFATTVSCASSPDPTGTLTLVKNVDNTAGGSAVPSDWTLTADGPETVSGPGNSPDVSNVTVSAGDYLLNESGGDPNYLPGTWQCTGGTLTVDTVTVASGANVTCSITNTSQLPVQPTGTLTLVKDVDNTGGGLATPDAWTLTATGPDAGSGTDTVSGPGNSELVTNVLVTAGTYALSESGGPGEYDAGGWSCAGGDLTGTLVTITAGAVVTCSITNTYAPDPSPPAGSLTLIKVVSGGTATPDAFTLTATGPETITGPGNSEAVTGNVVPIGTYDLSESGGPAGYTSGPWSCTGGSVTGATVSVTENSLVICTVTDTFQSAPPPTPPTLPTTTAPPTALAASQRQSRSQGSSPSSGSLASTGMDLWKPVLLAFSLLIVGAVLIVPQRRRVRNQRPSQPRNSH